eukprot:586151-Karenia_brevis.AAC.1
MVGFIDIVDSLENLRKPWLEKVPMDDPMYADELMIRSKEKNIMKDLVDRNASSRLIKNAHLLSTRLTPVPEPKVTDSGFVDNALMIDHQLSVVASMRKAYCKVVDEMRDDPSQDVLGELEDLEESMAMMRRDRHVEGEADAVVLINRSREDLMQDLYVPRKWRTPYRGYP